MELDKDGNVVDEWRDPLGHHEYVLLRVSIDARSTLIGVAASLRVIDITFTRVLSPYLTSKQPHSQEDSLEP